MGFTFAEEVMFSKVLFVVPETDNWHIGQLANVLMC